MSDLEENYAKILHTLHYVESQIFFFNQIRVIKLNDCDFEKTS